MSSIRFCKGDTVLDSGVLSQVLCQHKTYADTYLNLPLEAQGQSTSARIIQMHTDLVTRNRGYLLDVKTQRSNFDPGEHCIVRHMPKSWRD
jgi:hypothetical protein